MQLIDLPRDVLEIIVVRAGPEVRRVCRTFLYIVLSNVRTAIGVDEALPTMPKLESLALLKQVPIPRGVMRLDIASVEGTFVISAVQSMRLRIDQLPYVVDRTMSS